jgi:GNAT superfamily N-acetyltransferase
VVDSNRPQLINYLESQGATSDIVDAIQNRYSRVGIIRNMYVDEDARGQGIGNQLVSDAIDSKQFRTGICH